MAVFPGMDFDLRQRAGAAGRVRPGLAGIAVTACVLLAGAATTPRSAVVVQVPFIDRPLPPVLPQRVVLPPPPVVSATCRPEGLAVERFMADGVSGRAIQSLGFTNTSAETCSLTGRPRVTATLAGEAVAEAGPGDTMVPDPYTPRDLAPGDRAVMAVETSHNCDAALARERPRKPADGVVFHLETGDLAVPLGLDVICGFGVTKFGSARGPESIAPDIERLRVRAWFPPSAPAGERVPFVVLLTNPSSTPVSLRPCPGYRIDLSGPGLFAFAAPEFALNCDTITSIGAGQTVAYDASLPVPIRLAGDVTVAWSLVPTGGQDVGNLWVHGSPAEECLAPTFARPPLAHMDSMVVDPDNLLPNGLFLFEAQGLVGLPPDDPQAMAFRRSTLEQGRSRKDASNPTRCSLWMHL
ncbi:MAG: hypothetical protein QOG43_398 [Actinomycetota bacterium]|jgi:hypothetical protein|nr:hypothetical protein [Actinomycetota bacterium]